MGQRSVKLRTFSSFFVNGMLLSKDCQSITKTLCIRYLVSCPHSYEFAVCMSVYVCASCTCLFVSQSQNFGIALEGKSHLKFKVNFIRLRNLRSLSHRLIS